MSKKMMLIINPHSGKMQCKNYLFDMVDIFSRDGYEVTVFPTQKRQDATDMVINRANDFDLVACCGGDGTLNEVITGTVRLKNRPIIGYIPSGTTNDLATSLKLPKNMLDAAYNVIEGEPFGFDVGTFNDKYFAYIAAFGAFTDVSYSTSQQIKNYLGHLAYILQGIKQLGEIKSYRLTVEVDGEIIEDDFLFGAVTNSTSVAGLVTLDPGRVKLNDGLFEVLLIKNPKNIFELQQIVSGLLMQNYGSKYITLSHASRVKFTSPIEIPWSLDGEYGGKHQDISINNLQGAVRLMVSRDLISD